MDQRILVRDMEVNGMDAAAFSSFVSYLSAFVVRDPSLTLEGFNGDIADFSDPMNFFELRAILELHFMNRLHILKQYVLTSKKRDSHILLNYSDSGLYIEHLFGSKDLFEDIINSKKSWGVFNVSIV